MELFQVQFIFTNQKAIHLMEVHSEGPIDTYSLEGVSDSGSISGDPSAPPTQVEHDMFT